MALTRQDGRSRLDMLDWQAESFHSLRPDLQTQDGATSSPERLVLNPLFVEWLMGWPIGWTDCDCAETAFSLWLERQRSYLWHAILRPPHADLPMFSGAA